MTGNQSRIWLSPPHLGNLELQMVTEAFQSNWVAPEGPQLLAFEDSLKRCCSIGHATAVSSGTSAIHLALLLLGVGRGDVVLCQNFTFVGTVNPVRYLGAEPVFIGSEPDTWNMDPQALEEAIQFCLNEGKKPKAILPVHLYGMPARMEEIMAIGERYAIPVVEDAAEALGSTYKGKKCGSIGVLSVLSFNGNKIITTGGGGALLSDHREYIEKARFLATQAKDPVLHYEHSQVGYNYRMSNVLAGIGCGQMEVLDQRVRQRRNNYQQYRDYFDTWTSRGLTIGFQEEPEDHFSNRWLTCITMDPAENQGLSLIDLLNRLEENHIESRPLWKPMNLQPLYADCRYFGQRIEQKLFRTGLCLPSGSALEQEDFDRIFSVIDGFFGGH